MSIELIIIFFKTLLSVSLLLQSFELLSIASKIGPDSPWSWSHVRNDFAHWPAILLRILDILYEKYFKLLVLVQIILAMLLPLHPVFPALLLIGTYLLIALRFRGQFNGGSDTMTMTSLLSALLLSLPQPKVINLPLGLYFLAFQSTLSYFIAGMVKLKSKSWRTGQALHAFLLHSNYLVPEKLQYLSNNKLLMLVASYFIIIFECSFPILWLFPALTGYYLFTAFAFHIANYYIFGLNRFVFAWLCTYPALLLPWLRT